MSKPQILVVDDSPEIRLSAAFILEDQGFSILEAENHHYAQAILADNSVDLILLDMNFSLDTTSGEEGLRFLTWLSKSDFVIPVIAMTGWSNVDLAVSAMRLGACDFVEKPWNNQRLIQIIRQQLKMSGLQVQNQKLKQQLESVTEQDFTWRSESMEKLLHQIDSVAATDASILLTGDNGTGKSHLAKRIHQQSNRALDAFISVNMGAISESLFESEIFGHKKGAFTDAKENRIGRFELAKHGTLFLDEIANIPHSQQAKLLRVLESGEYEVLGSSQTQIADSRVICATNGDISKLIRDGDFREDLYFRLNTIELRVPSLQERFQDIAPLAKHFMTQHGKKYKREELNLSLSAIKALEAYHWPGNVREMSHLMERAVLLAQGDNLEPEDLHLSMIKQNNRLPMMTLEQAEKTLIEQALEQNHNNVPKASIMLGLTKSSMYRRLEKHGINIQ
ncbi:sigma-54 dependent transcriptional regulator [Colwellia sp. BRX8-9]|uniref:sigma-54-dependent transcriptional regulator n=1 Tax=Colwellia sp. BRX8-9 TaxID=2759831 RepID=UPI0015F3EE6F|nr:sigma-54 dependent transcriptional regulator [Colwellia sp. BRX8-9]MBA6346801.1 sigma-54-dependent Fis family transcriptional regulator [Colwellia sp. BRX8-9]